MSNLISTWLQRNAKREYIVFICCYGEGNGNPLQYSCLENLMDGRDWLAAVHGVAKSRTRLSDFTIAISIQYQGSPGGSGSKESAWSAGDLRPRPGLIRSPGEVNSDPLQYSCLENSTRSLAGYSPQSSRVGHDWGTSAITFIQYQALNHLLYFFSPKIALGTLFRNSDKNYSLK